MVKKVLIVGLFVGGGIYFIKKILPSLRGDKSSFDLDLEEYEADEYIQPKVTYTGGFGSSSNWERPDLERRFDGSASKPKSKKEFLYLNQI
jgi:hypothetical protein|tara:strand:- start:6217 stop:6489 length:273 start_codon:yes stop_codon:yes gene_type:complete